MDASNATPASSRASGSTLVALAGVGLAALAAGWLLGYFVPSRSERFYLLVPPAALAVHLLWNRPTRDERRSLFWKTLTSTVTIGVLCWLYMMTMIYQMMPERGPDFVGHVRGSEILIAVYFMSALLIVGNAIHATFQLLGNFLGTRFAPADSEGKRTRPRLAMGLEVVLPRVLTVAVALPYLLACLTTHRMKIPNAQTPLTLLHREFEDVSFQATDGTTLRGWYIPAKKPSQRTLLICHGLAANRTAFLTFMLVGDVMDANVLLFDFRGHGASDGHTISLGYWEKQDVLAAIGWLRSERPDDCRELLGVGISMGSASLIRAATEVEPPLSGLLIDSGFTSTGDMAGQIVWFLPAICRPPIVALGVPIAEWEMNCPILDVRPIDDIARVRAPVLFFHAEGDPMIPLWQGQALHDRAMDPKQMVVVKTNHHGGSLGTDPQGYFQHAQEFFKKPSPEK